MNKKRVFLLVFSVCLLLINSSYADVEATAVESGLSVSMKNNTANSWTLGGIRFENGGYVWTGNDNGYPTSYWTKNSKTVGGKHLLDLYFKSNAPGFNTAKLNPNETRTFLHPWASSITGAERVEGSEFLLLRTGSAGVPDDPIGADPITIDQLDSISQLSDFYSSTYRYSVYDSLGVRGGKYSGGFMDTWLGETQVQFAVPPNGFNVNMTPTTIDTVNLPKMYWMALALAQEYMNVDMQWMGAMASKESFSGTVNHLTQDLNQGGVYTPWHVENTTGLDRAMAYPVFFPKYQVQLASAADVTSSGVNPDDFLKYYCRNSGGTTTLNSATTISAIMVSITVQYNNYDVFAEAKDICWKESLEISRTEGDPFMGLAAMVASYNLGQWGQIGNVAGQLGASTYEANSKLPAPLGRDLFPTGNGNYRNQIIDVAQAFTDASRQSLSDNTIVLLDFDISKEELLDAFFGDNGTVATQGEGGLLRNFYEADKAVQRQEIWNTVSDAFELLKGKAPSTTGTENISYRYDFLGILRTVKGLMSFKREFRAAGDASILIPQHSGIGGCSNIEIDELYPYLSWTTNYDVTTDDYIVTMTVDDEIESKDVKWTLAYDWSVWNEVINPNSGGTTTTKAFDVVIPKADVEYYRSLGDGYSGYYVWIMGTDLSGNSTIKRLPVPYKSPQLIDSVAAYDSNGDGVADNVKAYIEPGGNTDISDFGSLSYSWPNVTPMTKVYPGDSKLSISGKVITINDNSLTSGVGLGEFDMEVDTAYGIYDPGTQVGNLVSIGPADILDRIGPAIKEVPLPEYVVPGTTAEKDTLKITFTEPVADIATSGTFLQFQNGTNSTPENATNIEKVSSTEYIFVFDNGKLANYTHVMIVPGAISDENGNSAADNNHWVPINKKELTDPSFDFASVKDTVGDGYGNKITYKITKGSTSADAIDFGDLSVLQYKWNQNGTETDVVLADVTISAEIQADFLIDIATNGAYGSGTGDAYIYFSKGSEKDTLTGTIVDSVGPAIESAIYNVSDNGGFDTLIVYLTETIEDNLDNSKKYLIIDGTQIDQDNVTKLSDKEYQFIVASNTVTNENQMIKLVHNSGLTDASSQKNPPLEINNEVKIDYNSATKQISSVEYHDPDADGIMSEVVINFTSVVDEDKNIKNMSFVINWLDVNNNPIAMNVAGTDFVKTAGNQIKWVVNPANYQLKEDLTSLSDSYGHVSITQLNEKTGSDETKDYDASIAVDKMAPVLVSAQYFKFKGAKDDELKIVFTEELSYTDNGSLLSQNEPFDFFKINGDEYALLLVADPKIVSGQAIPADTIVFLNKSSETPIFGDKLNIDEKIKIKDQKGNVQDYEENKYVFLDVFSAIAITNVSYHDVNIPRDGLIDNIKVITDTVVDAAIFSELVSKISLNSARNFAALQASDFSTFADANDTGFVIAVTQAANTTVNTGVTSSDQFIITEECVTSVGFIMNTAEDIRDSIAPVIVEAHYYPTQITPENVDSQPSDFLSIKFSENINYSAMNSNPLNFKRADNTSYSLNLLSSNIKADNKTVEFEVGYGSDKPRKGDSTQIRVEGNVVDNQSNSQAEDNVFKEIIIAEVDIYWNTGVYPNPILKDNETQIADKKKNLSTFLKIDENEIDDNMQAIVVYPLGIMSVGDDIEIKITILDAVGNAIVKDEKLTYSQDADKWYFLWDGQNKKKRDVGSGVYLAYIKILPESLGTIRDLPLKLGVGK